jgi:hypothetical protein
MIPGDHPVVQTEHHVRDAKIVEAGPGKPLEYRAPVIADIACNSTLKWRQSLNGISRFSGEEASCHAQRIPRH